MIQSIQIKNFKALHGLYYSSIKTRQNPRASGNVGKGSSGKGADGITEGIDHLVEGIRDFVMEAAFAKFLPDRFHRILFLRKLKFQYTGGVSAAL